MGDKQTKTLLASGQERPRNRLGWLEPAPVVMEDKLIEYYSKVELAPHSCRKAAEYTGMSHAWCAAKWAEIRERKEGLNQIAVETWRTAQMHDLDRAKEVCLAIMDDVEAAPEDRIAAANALMKCVDKEMKLTGTARPIQVQILEGPELEEFMKTLPADMIARVQAGDPKALLDVKAMMQVRKAGGG